MSYVGLGRNNQMWGRVEDGVKNGASAQEILASIEKISETNRLEPGNWQILLERLEKRREKDPEGKEIPIVLREELIAAIKAKAI